MATTTTTARAAANISQAIIEANKILTGTIESLKSLNGTGGNRNISIQDQAEVYAKELDFDLIKSQFMSVTDSIRKMRSSYLPSDLVGDIPLGATIAAISDSVETVSDNQAIFESFENTFMRMLGMPMSDDPIIAASEIIPALDPETGKSITKDFIDFEKDILDQRQLSKDARAYIIDENVLNTLVEDKTVLINNSLLNQGINQDATKEAADSGAVQQETNINLPDLKNNEFFKLSYLLIPPIQDARISKCINEPDKIVAKSFSSTRNRILNQKKLRPSLLETIIRIRRDRLSGTRAPLNVESDTTATVNISLGSGDSSTEASSSDYGLIESLFIVRLDSALSGLARRYIKIASEFSVDTESSGIQSDQDGSPPDGRHQGDAQQEAQNSKKVKSEEQILLEYQQTIENSITSLLVDNTGAIDLQENTQRTSSIHDGHLADGILGVLEVPNQRVKSRLNEIEADKKEGYRKKTERFGSEIKEIFGVSIGIGALDIIVFSLAMFTISEESLIGLLSEEQFAVMKENEFKDLLSGISEKRNTIESVDELTEFVIAGYQKFLKFATEDEISLFISKASTTADESS